MIPVKLHIKNFLSYGPIVQTIDFTAHRLICLSGKNGHGKSALLDAITWAVWGQARKISTQSKPDQGLLRISEVEMNVTFDFFFSNNKYRIRRDYSTKYGKPHAYLEFGILQENDYFVSLTDKTIKKTQEKIETTLGLDYETFINSSFLRQGQANEFSKKSAKERKELLSTILGLHHYDKAKTFVLEKIRSLITHKEHLEKLQLHHQEEYKSLQEVPEQLEQTHQAVTALENQVEQILADKNCWQSEQQTVQTALQKQAALVAKSQQEQKLFTQQEQEFYVLAKNWKTTHKLLLSLPDKKALEQKQQQLNQQLTEQQELLQKNIEYKEELLVCKQSLHTMINQFEKDFIQQQQTHQLSLERLQAQKESVKKQITEQEQQLTSLTSTLKNLQTIIATGRKTLPAELLISDFHEQQELFNRHKMLYQKWVEQGNWVNTQLKDLQSKQSLSQDSANPSCPLCEQNLSQARKRFLQKKFTLQTDFLQHRFNRIKKSITLLKASLQEHHMQLQKLKEIEQQELSYKETEKQSLQIQTSLTTDKQKLMELDQLETVTRTAIATLLKTTETARLEHKELNLLTAKIKTLEATLLAAEHNQQLHKTLITQLKDVQSQLTLCDQTHEYQAAQRERLLTITKIKSSLKHLKNATKQLETDTQKQQELITKEQALKIQEEELAQKVKQLSEQKELLLQKKGNLETLAQKRAHLEHLDKKYQEELKEYATQIHDLQQVATALGKDGVQALLIEDAIPEIEQETNDLLARLTDNQAHISIESLKDLKKGGTRETLDINISDSMGIRPYEMFSGGEAFRIDFALRIAISKLLARRAGTSLQTLIIDEGFGSQDDEGLSKIMDALYAIQNDFEKIIIVSHLPSMKEQFPVHFYIQKEAQGSTVTVIEHE
ncbi:MAG: SMC family ATPase [Proteobacteria bacterium]|nr:SMC family ATPase [Pseudomonadota bacterium]NBP14672.1 SMC family ATPase [bacterium]